MIELVDPGPWMHGSVQDRWSAVLRMLRARGWRVALRTEPLILGKGRSITIHPARQIWLRPSADVARPTLADLALLVHEAVHVLQGEGSRILWPLRYALDPWFRRRVEAEAYAHAEAVLLSFGSAVRYADPWVLRRRVYWLIWRDHGTAARIHARAADLVSCAQGGA